MKSKKTNKIALELQRIAEANGGLLNPETVVKEARHKRSPLHGSFTWDNTRAAHLWRLEQARHMIRVVVYVEPRTEKTHRVWVSLERDRGGSIDDGGEIVEGGYRTIEAVMSQKDLRQELLQQALADL